MNAFSGKVKVLLFLALSLFSVLGFSQVDKEFWFSVPYVNKNHAVNWDAANPDTFKLGGGQPIYLRLTTLDNPAVVTVSTPANPSGLNITLTIAANSTQTIDLTPYLSQVEVSQTYSTIINGAENKGIHIVSSDFISAYYENATIPNPEIFTLKGKNALGTDFYTPFQTNWPNDPLHNYQQMKLKSGASWTLVRTQGPDSAFSAFDIVATDDNTVVTITPSTDVVGHKKGETFTIVLQKGQTYSVRQLDQAITSLADFAPSKTDPTTNVYHNVGTNRDVNNLSGSYVHSSKPIAISVKDDSIFPSDATASGTCEDYVGDQIIPVTVIGKEYIVMKGHLDATLEHGTMTDWVFIVGVKDGTSYTTTDAHGMQSTFTINKGETQSFQVIDPYLHILAKDTSLYVFHISGFNCEFASAILPPIDLCTGSDQVGFTRTYGKFANERFFANILVRTGTGGETAFTSDTDNKIANIINAATFTPLPNGSPWAFTQIEFSSSDLTVGSHILKNTKAYFHFSMINSTVFSWDTTYYNWTKKGTIQLQGSSYGYFSSYNVSEPKAVIGNNSKKVIQVPVGVPVQLLGTGGLNYNWVGKKDVSGSWVDLPSPYYLDKVTGYNPVFNGTAPVGKYMYVATIVPACANVYIDNVYIEVIPPIVFNNVTDSICEDAPAGSKMGAGYNLFNLTDTIVGVKGTALGYTVSDWFVKKPAGIQILDDAESNVNVAYSNPVYAVFTQKVLNTVTSGLNTSLYCNQITNTSNGNQPIYSEDVSLPKTVTLASGVTFNMLVRPDITINSGWLTGVTPISVTMTLTNASNTNPVTAVQTFTSDDWKGSLWEQMAFNFASSTTGTVYDKLTLTFGTDKLLWAPMNFFMDNLNWYLPAHTEAIKNPTSYTLHDNDTVYAHITNPQFPFFSDTARVIMGVYASGKAAHNITLPAQCATKGSTLQCVDLTQYKYAVGGALVSSKDWYYDPTLTQPVPKPYTCVDITGSRTLYAKIYDSCQHVGSVAFNITEVPTVSDSSITVCKGTSIRLDDYTGYVLPLGGSPTIEWYSDAAFNNRLSGSADLTITDKQTVYAKIYNNKTCSSPAKLVININAGADISFTVKDVCLTAGSVALSATPVGGAFSGTGVSGFTFDPAVATPGKYGITYTYANTTSGITCTSIKTDSITVFAIPTATISATPASPLTYNTSTQLNVAVTGGKAAYTYAWAANSTLSSTTIQNPTTTNLTASQQYFVTVTDVNGCQNNDHITVGVKNAPLTLQITTLANSICLGETVNLTSFISGGFEPYTISWTSSPAGLSSSSPDTTHTPTIVGPITYTLSVTDFAGTTKSVQKTITVNPNPVITFANQIENVCRNGSLTLAPTITGTDATTTYSWSGSPVVVSPLNTATVATDATQKAGTYNVSLTVANGGGCSATAGVSVKINALPTAVVANVKGACVGVALPLDATPSGGTLPYSNLWTGNFVSGDLVNPTDEDPVFKSNTFGKYTLTYTVTDANKCSASATMDTFDLNELPKVSIIDKSNDSICQNTNSALLKAKVVSNVYPLNTYKFRWSGMDGGTTYAGSSDSLAIINISVPKTLTLTVTLTDQNGCSASDNIKYRVNPVPGAQIVGNAPVCEGVDLPLSAYPASSNYGYTWQGNITPKNTANVVFNAATSSTYKVSLEVKDKVTGCLSNANDTVIVKAKPTVDLKDTSICYLSSFQLNPTVSSPITDYNWTIDTVALNGRAHIKNPTFTASQNRNYTLALQVIENGCSASDTMKLTVKSLPVANAGNDTTAYNSIPFTLNGSGSGAAVLQYQWSPASYITSATTIAKPTAVISDARYFYLTVTDGNGCKANDSVWVNIPNTLPVVKVAPQTICGTQNVTLTAQPSGGTGSGYTYQWYQLPNTTDVISTNAVITVNVSQQTDFRVKMTNAPYQTVSADARVTVNTLPTATITPPEPRKVCIGNTLGLSAAPQTNVYTWHDNVLSTTGPSYLFNNSSLSGPSSIIVDIKDPLTGCTAQQTINIMVYPNPTVTIEPQNPSICAGETINLNAKVTGGTAQFNYSWTQNTSATSLSTTSSLAYTNTVAGPYTIHVLVTDANNCTASASDIVSVNKVPDFGLPKDVYTACTNQKLVLNVDPLGASNGNLKVTWSPNPNLDTTKSTIAPVFMRTAAANPSKDVITYTIYDGKGCPKIGTVTINTYSAPVVTTPDTLWICMGAEAQIQASVSGYSKSLQWEGYVSPSQNVLVTTFTANRIPRIYTVSLTAANDYCKSTDSTKIIVRQKPVSVITSYYQIVPFGAQLDLTGTYKSGYGTPPYTGKWLPVDYIASVQSGSNGYIAKSKYLVSNQTFHLVTTDTYGCTDTATTSVKVEGGIDPLTPGDSTNKPYDPKTPINPNDYPKNGLNYRGSADICMGESYTILTQIPEGTNGSGDYSYKWTANNSTFTATTPNITVTPTRAVTAYTLEFTDNKYKVTSKKTFTIYAHPLPDPHISTNVDPDGVMYELQSYVVMGSINGGSSPYKNVWKGTGLSPLNTQITSFTPAVEGSYRVTYTVTDSYGCVGEATRTFTVKPLDVIDVNIPSIVCGDGSVQSYEVRNTDNGTYEWTISDPTIRFGGTTSNVAYGKYQNITWNKPGVYTITVRDITGGISSTPKNPKTFTVTVYEAIDQNKLSEAIQGPKDVCEYEKVNYSLNSSIVDASVNNIQWSIASDPKKIQGSSIGQKVTVQWGKWDNVWYHDTVKVVASNAACKGSLLYPVTIHKNPTPNFVVRPLDSVTVKQIYANKIVDYDNRTYIYNLSEIDNESRKYTYFWDFAGDGVYVEDQYEPHFSYDQKGTYYTSLIAVDPVWGCRDTITKPVVVVENPNCGLKYPNAFTPEAKSDNKFTYGYCEGIVDKDYNLKIFNRWGQLLWETNSRTDKWDGTYKGEVCKQDVYVYHSTATCENGQVLKINGDVTLIK